MSSLSNTTSANGSSHPRTARWEHDTAMLASSMMLVSISEETPSYNIGYKSRLTTDTNSRRGSASSLSGWGSPTTRKSFKTDLASLAAETEPMDMSMDCSSQPQQEAPAMPYPMQHSTANQDDEGWGYFDADAFCQRQ